MTEEIKPAEATEEAKVTFNSVVQNEIAARTQKYRNEAAAINAEAAKKSQELSAWYNAAIASPEYARLTAASEKILNRVNAAAEEDFNEKLGEVEKQFNEEWQKASDRFDEMYAKNPEKAVKRAIEAVDYLEYEYTKQTLKVAEMIVDFHIELVEFELDYLRWLKKFCKNPEWQLEKAGWYVERFLKKAERYYAEIQDELKKASYSEDSDEAEFAQALRAFLDKFVG